LADLVLDVPPEDFLANLGCGREQG
jgi:hypothetical protein